ncbi:MAG TPA: Xaa-Pro peptidase family protein [Bacillota bacterium]|nr:Xaa-Pro peptidase family protein [Bacillota bacterium]
MKREETLAGRLSRLRSAIEEAGLDGFLVTGADPVRYLTGFAWGHHGYLVVTGERAVLVVRPTEYQEAQEEAQGVGVVLGQGTSGAEQAAAEALRGSGRVGFDPGALSFSNWECLGRLVSPGTELVSRGELLAELRAVKEPGEIESIRQAAGIYDRALEEVVPKLTVGMTELEITARLEYACRLAGAEGFWFPSIVASGPRSALPHGLGTARRVGPGEPLVIDMGPIFGGVPSDATRTVFVQPPGPAIREVYAVVLGAQQAALEVLREGVPCSEVDRAARRVIDAAGYGEHFNHPVGHGVGGPPVVGPDVDRPLIAGMVITVEPGIYLPGRGGVRIEDTVAITSGGCEVLHRYPKTLTVAGNSTDDRQGVSDN